MAPDDPARSGADAARRAHRTPDPGRRDRPIVPPVPPARPALPPGHLMPVATFDALARGEGGPAAIGELVAARRSRTMLLIHALVQAALGTGHPEAPLAVAAQHALARAQRQAPAAVTALLDYPLVGAWAMRTVDALWSGSPQACPGGLAAVAAAAAIRGRVPMTVDLPPLRAGRNEIVLPSLGVAWVCGAPDGQACVRVTGQGGAEVVTRGGAVPVTGYPVLGGPDSVRADAGYGTVGPGTGGAGWQPLPGVRLPGDPELRLVVDGGPIAAAPLPGPVRVLDLAAGPELDHWQRSLAAGWRLLLADHGDTAAELAAGLRVLTPLAVRPGGHSSATYTDAFGCLAMSLPADPVTVALTLAHEIQHAKLSALMDLFPLLRPVRGEVFYAPWRPDPRPVDGLLHGMYAHLGVTRFWSVRRAAGSGGGAGAGAGAGEGADGGWPDRADVEFARWRRACAEATEQLLRSGRLTDSGLLFIHIGQKQLREWAAQPVPAAAQRAADAVADAHRSRWQATHGEPPG